MSLFCNVFIICSDIVEDWNVSCTQCRVCKRAYEVFGRIFTCGCLTLFSLGCHCLDVRVWLSLCKQHFACVFQLNILVDTGSSNFAVAAAAHPFITHYFNTAL